MDICARFFAIIMEVSASVHSFDLCIVYIITFVILDTKVLLREPVGFIVMKLMILEEIALLCGDLIDIL